MSQDSTDLMGKKVKFHIMKEYQELLPPLPEDQYDLLMKTIKEEGQHDPITVNSNGVVCTTDSGYVTSSELHRIFIE